MKEDNKSWKGLGPRGRASSWKYCIARIPRLLSVQEFKVDWRKRKQKRRKIKME